jgi:iron complex transport system substrate-binding protein
VGLVPELRILPLISSATEIVHALGLGRFQVGRSHECDYPAEVLDLPICTRPAIAVNGSSAEIDQLVKQRLYSALSIYEVDAPLIRELRPTHIITQTQCKVCAVSLDDVQSALRDEWAVAAQIVSCEPYALADVWNDIQRIAGACCEAERGDRLVADLRNRMAAVRPPLAGRPTVVAIEWLEPLMTAGNWVPELIERAGGVNLFGTAGQHSPWMTWEQFVRADSDVIVALPCGFDLTRTREEMHWLTERAEWPQLKAVRHGRVYICDGNQFMNRPGPRLVESLEIFAQMLHSERFPPSLENIGWQHFGNGVGDLNTVKSAVLDENFVGVRARDDHAR